MIKSIHPVIWNQIIKMYNFCYKTDKEIKSLFTSLDLKTSVNNIKIDNLKEFFLTLSVNDTIVIFKDILEIDDFWFNEYDDAQIRNAQTALMNYYRRSPSYIFSEQSLEYVPPEHKLWGQELVRLLENKNGIIYDRKTKSFSFVGVSDIRFIPYSTRKTIPLVTTSFNNYFYDNLVGEINHTYFSGFYTATAILSRKIMENLIIDFLISKYPPNSDQNLDLYYDKTHRRHKRFSELIDVLESKKTDFVIQEQTLSRLISRLHTFKTQANLNTHTLTIITDENEILNYKLQEMIELLNELKGRTS